MSDEQNNEVVIWRRRWFQWMLVALVGCAILGFVVPPFLSVIYAVRPVLLPVVIAIALAYIFNPPISWAHHRLKIPRWLGTTMVLMVVAFVAMLATLLIVPPLADQAGKLVNNLKDVYPNELLQQLEEKTNTDLPEPGNDPDTPDAPETSQTVDTSQPTDSDPQATQNTDAEQASLMDWVTEATNEQRVRELVASATEALSNLEWKQVYTFAISSLDVGVGVVGSAISFTSYVLIGSVIVAFCFFFFSWKFEPFCEWFIPFIPVQWRTQTLDILHKMDMSVAAFIRGRLIQSFVMGVVLCIGWWIAGVPYWLLLGLLSGLLNLVPFAAVFGCIAAVGLTSLDAVSGGTFSYSIIIWPVAVYVFAQSLDGWVIEPIVQGAATDLDPVSVLLVVMVGGAVAGLLGMLLAIPAAACIKILSKEILLPKLRSLASEG